MKAAGFAPDGFCVALHIKENDIMPMCRQAGSTGWCLRTGRTTEAEVIGMTNVELPNACISISGLVSERFCSRLFLKAKKRPPRSCNCLAVYGLCPDHDRVVVFRLAGCLPACLCAIPACLSTQEGRGFSFYRRIYTRTACKSRGLESRIFHFYTTRPPIPSGEAVLFVMKMKKRITRPSSQPCWPLRAC